MRCQPCLPACVLACQRFLHETITFLLCMCDGIAHSVIYSISQSISHSGTWSHCRHWNIPEPHPGPSLYAGSWRCRLLRYCGVHGGHSCRAGQPEGPQHHPILHQLQQPNIASPAYRPHLPILQVQHMHIPSVFWLLTYLVVCDTRAVLLSLGATHFQTKYAGVGTCYLISWIPSWSLWLSGVVL